jgi:hypothetical protein
MKEPKPAYPAIPAIPDLLSGAGTARAELDARRLENAIARSVDYDPGKEDQDFVLEPRGTVYLLRKLPPDDLPGNIVLPDTAVMKAQAWEVLAGPVEIFDAMGGSRPPAAKPGDVVYVIGQVGWSLVQGRSVFTTNEQMILMVKRPKRSPAEQARAVNV